MRLLSNTIGVSRRQKIGWGLILLGVAATIPAARMLFGGRRKAPHARSLVEQDSTLIGAHRFPRKGDDDLTP